MKKLLITSLLMLATRIFKEFNSGAGTSLGLTRLKMSLLYIKGIKTVRLLFVSAVGIRICLMFALFGFVLFNITLFVFTPWSNTVKMYVGFFCTAVYFGIAFFISSYLFSQTKWMEIFHAQTLINELAKAEAAASYESMASGKNNHGEDESYKGASKVNRL